MSWPLKRVLSSAAQTDLAALKEEFEGMKHGAITARQLAQAVPAHVRPSEEMARIAEKVLLKLIEQSDSIICDPDDLADRAWQIAAAMAKQYMKRCT